MQSFRQNIAQQNAGVAPQNSTASTEIMKSVSEFIRKELLQQSNVQIQENTLLLGEGLITSLQAIELVMFLEEQFNIKVKDDEVIEDNFSTLRNIAHFVKQKRQEAV